MSTYDDKTIRMLKSKAREMRRILITSRWGHLAGTLCLVDVMAALYFYKMKVDPNNPLMDDRDRVVMGKAHCAGTAYAALGLAGFYSKERYLPLYGGNHALDDGWRTNFQPHTDAWALPGIDFSGGSLGQGLGFACGLALGARIKAAKDPMRFPAPSYNVYCISGDGETQEGLIWESAMLAGQYQLSNLVNILDYNKYNIGGPVAESVTLEPILDKFKAFGWYVAEMNGHDLYDIVQTLDAVDRIQDKPKFILAHTIKGRGVPAFEFSHTHGGALSAEEQKVALETYLAPLPEA
jgi:transketolase